MTRSRLAPFAAIALVVGGLGVGAAVTGSTTTAQTSPSPGAPSVFVPIAPYRTLDTRQDGNPVDADDDAPDKVRLGDPAAENPLPVPVQFAAGLDGAQIPDEATAVSYNVTVARTEGYGYVQVDTSPGDPGATSTVNWTSNDQTIANSGIVQLGVAFDDQGFVTVYVGGEDGAAAHVILDITGYFVPASGA